ncbi:MAG: CDP-archaeol synthase [Verrucomicrobiota bacterium]
MPASAKDSRKITFFRRFGSTAGLWLITALALILGLPVLFYAMIIVLVVLGLLEYFHLLNLKDGRTEAKFTVVIGAIYTSAVFWQAAVDKNTMNWAVYDGVAIAAIVFTAFVIHLKRPVQEGKSHIAIMASVFGFIYIGILLSYSIRVCFFDDGTNSDAGCPGRWYLLFALVTTKFTDMGAYCVGSLIGKNKMIPHISPGKTWEGTLGAIVFTMIGAYGVTWLFDDGTSLLTPVHTAILAFLVFIGAVVGDLAESILKRSFAQKDSGSVMPGIGGILDLVDSLIFTMPIVYFYLLWLSR